MNARRDLLVTLGVGALASPLESYSLPSTKVIRIGFLEATSASGYSGRLQALRAGLRDLGYVEGSNIVIELLWADGQYERLPALAAQLVQSRPDIIVAASPPAVRAVMQATSAIPIVMVAVGDPVGAGFVASLSRPGGNVTGLSNINVSLSGKYLDLLGVAIPKLARVAVLVNPGHPTHPESLAGIQAASRMRGVQVAPLRAGTPSQIEAAIDTMTLTPGSALIVLPDPLFLLQAPRIAELAAKSRLPTMFWARELAEAGGLMSYGPDLAEQFRRAAAYVDKILKGAKPADLPVEQPTRFYLTVNLRTAKALGITIPQTVLLRADEVIE
jgi:putative ABC transport system substrate-binding protein